MTTKNTDTPLMADCPSAHCSASFTPGPWTIAAESGDWFPVLENYDPIPATIENAVLIAAAPKMLAALQFYAAHMKLGYEITDSGQVAEEAIREALWQNSQADRPQGLV